jgi:hypothetical protein
MIIGERETNSIYFMQALYAFAALRATRHDLGEVAMRLRSMMSSVPSAELFEFAGL